MGHVLLLALVLAGCARRAPEASSSPEASVDAGGMADDEVDELAALERQLALRTGQLQAAGVGPRPAPSTDATRDHHDDANAGPAAAPVAGASPKRESRARTAEVMGGAMGASSGRCERVCEISAAICALEGQICGLLPRHPDDPRYQAACERAAGDCRFATEACHVCE